MRAVAVDWSGSVAGERRHIWTAEAADGRLVSLTAGRTRTETIIHLLDRCAADPTIVIGLDFAFSYPEWWVKAIGAKDGPGAWELTSQRGEQWLTACRPPFWGRPGCRRPALPAGCSQWRRTEVGLTGVRSVFQIGGAGSVGTGSIRGMGGLLRLARAGVAVWPFDPWPAGRTPVVAEVWPRSCIGRVVKSRPESRAAHLSAAWPCVRGAPLAAAVASDDAFDAACTALTLSLRTGPPPGELDALDLVEGRILA